MRQPTRSSKRNSSKHTITNHKTKPTSKPGRQSSRAITSKNRFVVTTNTKNDVDVEKAGIVNNTDTEEKDLIKEIAMNSVNRTQSQQVVTPCSSRLKRNRKSVNTDLQLELSKESEEESSTESIGKQPNKVVTQQSRTSSENDDKYKDENSSSDESSYIAQTPKKAESYSSRLTKMSKISQKTVTPSSIIVNNGKERKSSNKNTPSDDLNSTPASSRQISKESFRANVTVDSNMNVDSKVRIYGSIAPATLITNSNYRNYIRYLQKKLHKYDNEDTDKTNVNIDLETKRPLEPMLKEKLKKDVYLQEIIANVINTEFPMYPTRKVFSSSTSTRMRLYFYISELTLMLVLITGVQKPNPVNAGCGSDS